MKDVSFTRIYISTYVSLALCSSQERETGLFFVGEGSFESRKKVLEVSGCGFGGSQAGRAEAVTAFHAELSGTRLPACLHLPLPSSPPRLLRIVFVHTRVSRVLHPARHYAPRAVVITIAIAVEPNRPRDSVPSFFVPSSHPPPPPPLAPCLSSSTHARTHTYVCVCTILFITFSLRTSPGNPDV